MQSGAVDEDNGVKLLVEESRQGLLETKRCLGCDFAGVDLVHADLSGVTLGEWANLQEADLRWTDLTGAKFCKATMPGGAVNYSGR